MYRSDEFIHSLALLVLQYLNAPHFVKVGSPFCENGLQLFPPWAGGFWDSAFLTLSTVFLLDPPFLTNEELAALPVVRVLPSGRYTGAKLKSVIRMLRGLLDQGIPSKELEVSGTCQWFYPRKVPVSGKKNVSLVRRHFEKSSIIYPFYQ